MASSQGAGPKRKSKKVFDPDFVYDLPSSRLFQDDTGLTQDELTMQLHFSSPNSQNQSLRSRYLRQCHYQMFFQHLLSLSISSFNWSSSKRKSSSWSSKSYLNANWNAPLKPCWPTFCKMMQLNVPISHHASPSPSVPLTGHKTLFLGEY